MGNRNNFYVDIMSASPEVTGSCMYCTVRYPDSRFEHFFVDGGLFQEEDYSNLNSELLFNPKDVDFALVTHNHIDHTGRFPFLVKNGFNAKIYTSEDTQMLMPIALADTFRILNQRAKKSNTSPLYTESDVSRTIHMLSGYPYGETFRATENIRVTLFKNGHLIGASIILVQIDYYGYDSINLLFLGDYNNKNIFFDVPSLPEWVLRLPLTIVCESTYGDMDTSEIHEVFEDNIRVFFTKYSNGTVVLPVFSLGRSQEILKKLKVMQESSIISKEVPIYLDGKLTLQYTNLFLSHQLKSIEDDKNTFIPENIHFVSKDFRPYLWDDDNCKIIVSSSGMGSYGPAQTYIQQYLRRENALIHFTGYAAEGTIARQLYDAAEDSMVEFGGLTILKKARIKFTNEFSAHAKANELISFLKEPTNINLVLVTHGQTEVKKTFSKRVLLEVNPKDVGILSREYFFRMGSERLLKTLPTHFVM